MKLFISFLPFLLIVFPFHVNERPIPTGTDFAKILPLKVGSYTRIDYQAPGPGLDGEAVYRDGKKEIFMLFSKARDRKDLKETMETIHTEIKKEKTTEREVSLKTDPMFIRFQGKTIAFFAWTRDLYCFSADAKGGSQEDLEMFMKKFPY